MGCLLSLVFVDAKKALSLPTLKRSARKTREPGTMPKPTGCLSGDLGTQLDFGQIAQYVGIHSGAEGAC